MPYANALVCERSPAALDSGGLVKHPFGDLASHAAGHGGDATESTK